MSKEVIRFWQDWVDRQEDEGFILNSDNGVVDDIAVGVLDNELKRGFKYCPCRLPSGNAVKDVALICPCNFKIQDDWKEEGKCRCSLFIKRKAKEA